MSYNAPQPRVIQPDATPAPAVDAHPAASLLTRLLALPNGLASRTCSIRRLPGPTARAPELWQVVDGRKGYYYRVEFGDWYWKSPGQFRVCVVATHTAGRGGTQLYEGSLLPADVAQVRVLVALCHMYRHYLCRSSV